MKNKNTIWIYPLIIIGVLLVITSSCSKKDDNNGNNTSTTTTVTDIDGNVYHTVTIGTQVWMVENLKTTKYRDGSAVPNINDSAAWSNLTTGAYCDYSNIPGNSTTYGRLYNWYVVNDSRNIAPTGWHVPTDGEWNIMEKYLDNTVDTTATGFVGTDIGGKLKETGTTHWDSPNTGATNSSGFTALPGGYRSGTFYDIGSNGCWWSNTESNAIKAYDRYLSCDSAKVDRGSYGKVDGYSVRCLKD